MSQRAYERAYDVESQGIRFKGGMEIVIKCARTAIDMVFYIRLRSLVQSSCSVFMFSLPSLKLSSASIRFT